MHVPFSLLLLLLLILILLYLLMLFYITEHAATISRKMNCRVLPPVFILHVFLNQILAIITNSTFNMKEKAPVICTSGTTRLTYDAGGTYKTSILVRM
jgi:hypothetical protein